MEAAGTLKSSHLHLKSQPKTLFLEGTHPPCLSTTRLSFRRTVDQVNLLSGCQHQANSVNWTHGFRPLNSLLANLLQL
ncbi:hypothetical protein FRX31_027543, partial [Thalictrum thalictroides]